MLGILQDEAVSDLKKYCIVMYAIIPLFAATCVLRLSLP